jgi:hypothetical protein
LLNAIVSWIVGVPLIRNQLLDGRRLEKQPIGRRVEEATNTTLVVLQELATTLEDVLARVNDLSEQERTAAAT